MRIHRCSAALLIVILIFPLLAGCQSREKKLESWQVQDWKEDIDYLSAELPQVHINPFYKISRSEFEKQIRQLEASLDQMNEDEVRVELQRIVASLGDSHTATTFSAKEMYPLDLAWFGDGWYVINTKAGNRSILYCKLVKINGRPVEKVMSSIAGIISHENDSWLQAQGGYYLVLPTVLHGLHIIGADSRIPFTFQNTSGSTIELALQPVDGTTAFEQIIGKGTINVALPLYRQNSDQAYWCRYLPESGMLYFKYNQGREMEDRSIAELTRELMELVNRPDCQKVVIDLRDNQGGSSNLFDGFITQLAASRLNRAGSLYVIIGKKTFSAAVLDAVSLKTKTGAVLVGEPTGGKPDHFGEKSYFRLPKSKIAVSYSTKYFEPYADKDASSLIPDKGIDITINDYVNGVDPVMNYIIKGENHE